jgi:MFS family permease
MVDYSKAISKGLRFGVNPKRWLQFFILDLIFLGIGFSIILPNMPAFLSLISGNQGMTNIMGMLGTTASIIAIFIIWILVRIWFTGSIVHQSNNEKEELGKSFRIACRKYPSIFMAVLIVAIIGMVVNMIPYVGWVVAIIVSWMFFFILQGVMVSKLGFSKAIENSYKMFRKKPLQVFLAWLLITIITMVIYLIFTLPAMAMMFSVMMPYFGTMALGSQAAAPELISSMSHIMQTNMVSLIVVGIIALIGFAIATTFALKAQTEFYNQLRKKFKIF